MTNSLDVAQDISAPSRGSKRRTYKSLLDAVSKHCSQKSALLAGRTRRAEVDMVLGRPPVAPMPAPSEGELMPPPHLFRPPVKSNSPPLQPDIVPGAGFVSPRVPHVILDRGGTPLVPAARRAAISVAIVRTILRLSIAPSRRREGPTSSHAPAAPRDRPKGRICTTRMLGDRWRLARERARSRRRLLSSISSDRLGLDRESEARRRRRGGSEASTTGWVIALGHRCADRSRTLYRAGSESTRRRDPPGRSDTRGKV